MDNTKRSVNPFWTLLVCNNLTTNGYIKLYIKTMSTESLNRTSIEIENPSQNIEAQKKVNVNVLKQRLLEEKKKEKVKRTIIVSSVVASLGVLTFLTY